MTSKESLERLKKHYIQLANQSKFHYTQLEEEYFNTIEKDLEVLEILKQHLVVETMDNENTSWEQVNCYLTKGKIKSLENDEEFKKTKEWLENDK